jgi:hypothetical protein
MTGEKRERAKLLGGVRSVAAGGILWSWARMRGDVKPTAPQWRAAAVAGALFFLIGHGGLFWAEQRIASGPASLLVATERRGQPFNHPTPPAPARHRPLAPGPRVDAPPNPLLSPTHYGGQ